MSAGQCHPKPFEVLEGTRTSMQWTSGLTWHRATWKNLVEWLPMDREELADELKALHRGQGVRGRASTPGSGRG